VLSRLRASPALRESPDLPQAERLRGAALAERLSIPVLGRVWQMLLKGVSEVEAAPDRRAAAEMVLIRLCYLADQPTPGDLVRRLVPGGETPRPVPAAAPTVAVPREQPSPVARGWGGNGGAALSEAAPDPAPSAVPAPAPQPKATLPETFRDVISLVREQREMTLYGHLLHSVHLVRYAPPVIEIRPQSEAPRDLAAKLAAVLGEVTGLRWTIAISTAEGEPTIDAQRQAADQGRADEAAEHPLVQAIMAAFPGAKLEAVRDPMADEYRLPPPVAVPPEAAYTEAEGLDLPEDMPDFAPPDAEPADEMELEDEG
jgi:DNA polymerase III subunit gamma/tau